MTGVVERAAVRCTTYRLRDFTPLLTATALLGLWAVVGEMSPIAYLGAAFFLNPVFTSGPIRERLELPPIASAFDWSVVAVISIAAVLSGSQIAGVKSADLAGAAVVGGLALALIRERSLSLWPGVGLQLAGGLVSLGFWYWLHTGPTLVF